MIKVISNSDIAQLATKDLIDLFNTLIKELPEAERPKEVTRFATRDAGILRVKNLVTVLKKAGKAEQEGAAPKAPKAPRDPNAPKAPRKHKGINLLPPGSEPTPCREGSKQAIMVDLLKQKGGATMEELLQGLSGGKKPWQEVTVRSGFGWDMKQHGYGVRSIIKEGEPERFQLVVPGGFKIPPHRENKSVAEDPAHVSEAAE